MDGPSQYKSHLLGHSPPANLGAGHRVGPALYDNANSLGLPNLTDQGVTWQMLTTVDNCLLGKSGEELVLFTVDLLPHLYRSEWSLILKVYHLAKSDQPESDTIAQA